MQKIYQLLAVLLLLTRPCLRAQTANDTAALFDEMKRLQSLYRSQGLSFDIRYTYASEQTPSVILDSLNGSMEVSGNNYRYRVDSVEMIVNSNYSITLFKKNKLMYLSKPSPSTNADPVQQLRLMLQKGGLSGCTVKQETGFKTVRIYFEASSPYRQVEMSIDKKTGYITSMRYVMKTAMLLGTSAATDVVEANARYGEYAIVETTFSHYAPLTADSARFNESNFFYKAGPELKTTSDYHEYKIFKGSPNL